MVGEAPKSPGLSFDETFSSLKHAAPLCMRRSAAGPSTYPVRCYLDGLLNSVFRTGSTVRARRLEVGC